MPRSARKYLHAPYYHVMVQGINKDFIFNDNRFKNIYLKNVYECTKEFKVSVIAYCIMSNHVHLLLKPADILTLSKFMHKVNLLFGIIYNNDKNRVGYVFRDRFRAEPILEREYLYRRTI